jgi:PAS domain S-box-containing protein
MGLFRKREGKPPEQDGADARGVEDLLVHRSRVEEVIGERGGGYWELIESSRNLIQSVTPDGHFFYVNRAWLETLGYGPDDVKELTFLDTIHPDSRTHCSEVFKQLMSGEKYARVCCDFVAKDGTRVAVEGNVSCRLEEGRPIATRGFFRKVSPEGEMCKDEIEELKPVREPAEAEIEILDGIPLEDLYLTFHDLTSK